MTGTITIPANQADQLNKALDLTNSIYPIPIIPMGLNRIPATDKDPEQISITFEYAEFESIFHFAMTYGIILQKVKQS